MVPPGSSALNVFVEGTLLHGTSLHDFSANGFVEGTLLHDSAVNGFVKGTMVPPYSSTLNGFVEDCRACIFM
jgi:hypothetical protein